IKYDNSPLTATGVELPHGINKAFSVTYVQTISLDGGNITITTMDSVKATTRLRCHYNHSERKNHTKFFAEPPPHWSTTIPHRLNPSLHQLLKTNHPFLFVFHLPLSTESLPRYL